MGGLKISRIEEKLEEDACVKVFLIEEGKCREIMCYELRRGVW
jgi:hypothetical protein